jgi:hypothetical protein
MRGTLPDDHIDVTEARHLRGCSSVSTRGSNANLCEGTSCRGADCAVQL